MTLSDRLQRDFIAVQHGQHASIPMPDALLDHLIGEGAHTRWE
jgi:hypothetical protein